MSFYPHTYRSQRSPVAIIALIFFLCVVGYGVFELRGVLSGPRLTILEPDEWSVSTSSLIIIRGTAPQMSKLALNGRQIFTDEKGSFVEELLLPDGYSILELVATDRLNRTVTKQLHIYNQ